MIIHCELNIIPVAVNYYKHQIGNLRKDIENIKYGFNKDSSSCWKCPFIKFFKHAIKNAAKCL